MNEFVILQGVGDVWRVVSRHITELRALEKLKRIAKPGETYMIVSVWLTYSPRRD